MAEAKASFGQMYFIALMMSMGVGNLALPYELSINGLLPFAFIFGGVAASMVWSMLAMLRAKAAIEERGIRVATYQDLGYDLMGGAVGKGLVDAAVIGYQFGVCCAYFSFVSVTLKRLFPGALSEFQWTLVAFPFVAVPCNLRHFRDLGSVAKVATAFYMSAWGVTMAYALERLIVRGDVHNTALAPASPWSLVPLFGAVCYSFEGIPASLVQITNTLSEPERAGELVATSLAGISAVFVLTGYVCVLAFRDPANPITLSLMAEFGEGGLPGIANGLVVLAVILKYPLQFYPMISQLERNLRLGPGAALNADGRDSASPGRGAEREKLLGAAAAPSGAEPSIFISEHDGGLRAVAFRTTVVAATAAVANLVADLTTIIAFVGIVFGPALAFIFPCFFDVVCVHRRAYDRTRPQVAISVTIIVAAVIASIVGLGTQIAAYF